MWTNATFVLFTSLVKSRDDDYNSCLYKRVIAVSDVLRDHSLGCFFVGSTLFWETATVGPGKVGFRGRPGVHCCEYIVNTLAVNAITERRAIYFLLPCDSVRFIEYRKDFCRGGWLCLMCCHWNELAHFTNGGCKIVCCQDACQNRGLKRFFFFCFVWLLVLVSEEMCDWVKNQCDVYHNNNNNCAGRAVTTMTVFSPGHL